jgi:GT2 family glycosyltransferase
VGDDIIATETLVEQHLQFHNQHSPDSRCAVLGYIRWAPELKVTRFMHWIGEMGWQFGFSLINDPMDLPFNYFYTSNISLPRARFLECGGFDEDFREYGWEDIELSCRLKDRGLKIIYNREALAYHDHPTTLASFCQRQTKVGYSALCFYKKHPEMEKFLSIHWIPNYSLKKRLALKVIRLFSEWSEHMDFIDATKYYQDLMSYYYFQGLKRALDNER